MKSVKQKFSIGKNSHGWFVIYFAYAKTGDKHLVCHQVYTELKTKSEAIAIRRKIIDAYN